jgi:Ca2+-binding EF-hand superfamily protein
MCTMIKTTLPTETCYYITASSLAREFYDLGLDDAGDAIDSIVGSADLASSVDGEIGRAMVSVRQFIRIMSAECEPEIVETIRKVFSDLSLDKDVYIDIYN